MCFITIVNKIEDIAELPLESKVIVDGLPGTGKTESVIKRIKYLVDEYELNPGYEILVLSFTNNAVGELKSRVLEQLTTSIYYRYLNVLTFDKFAWRLLSYTHRTGRKHGRSYARNIYLAKELLRNGHLYHNQTCTHDLKHWTDLDDIKYLIIDEVQDVNTHRAEFVFELINYMKRTHKNKMGFLFLGDLNQEIFGYQARNNPNAKFRTPTEFLTAIRDIFGAEDITLFIDFNKNPRYEYLDKDVLKTIIHATNLLKNDNFTKNLYKSQINDNLPHTDPITDTNDLINTLKPFLKNGGKTALLYRKNRFAMNISLLLFQNGIQHRYLIKKSIYPAWIAKICWDLYFEEEKEDSELFVHRSVFENTWNQDLESKTNLDWEKAWTFFVYLATGKENHKQSRIKYLQLLENLKYTFDQGKLIGHGTDSKLIVTNFHKAKGREYENVFIDEFSYKDHDLKNELQTMYVGITRARNTCKIFRYKPRTYKPYDINNLIPIKGTKIFSIRPKLYEPEDPESFLCIPSDNNDEDLAEKRQKHLWENMSNLIGRSVNIKIYDEDEKVGEIIYDNYVMGNISKVLDIHLKNWLRKHYYSADQLLTGATIVSIYSHTPDNYTRILNRLPNFNKVRIWLGAKILGNLYIER